MKQRGFEVLENMATVAARRTSALLSKTTSSSGVAHLKVSGKGGKTRCVPLNLAAGGCVGEYLWEAGHASEGGGALFRLLRHSRPGSLAKTITPDGIYKIFRGYYAALGFEIGTHALRATSTTNALDHRADISKA